MTETVIEKKRKVDLNASGITKQPKASKIFSPFRVLGNVTDSTPLLWGH